MKGIKFFSLVIFAFILCTACVNYSKEMKKAFTKILPEYKKYTFRCTPIGNFGVGTIYSAKLLNKNMLPDTSWLIAHPSTWFKDSLTDQEKEEWNKRIFPEGAMGSHTLTENISTKLNLTAAIPNIQTILNVGAAFNLEKGVKITLKAEKLINRQMNWGEFSEALRKDKFKPYVKESIQEKNVLIGCKDLLLKGYSAEITIDENLNPKLNAELNKKAEKTTETESSFGINLTRKKDGHYVALAQEPVVVAVLYMYPPTFVRSVGLKTFMTEEISMDISKAKLQGQHVVIETKLLKPLEDLLTLSEEKVRLRVKEEKKGGTSEL